MAATLPVKIMSWNVNALAPVVVEVKARHGSMAAWLGSPSGAPDASAAAATRGTDVRGLGVDILCVQEAKLARAKVTAAEALVEGYESYWSFNVQKGGYCGVTTYVRHGPLLPVAVEDKPLKLPEFDDEGRCLMTDHGAFVLFNVYVPNAGDGGARRPYKVSFLRAFTSLLQRVVATGRMVIVCGDFNIAAATEDVHPRLLGKEAQLPYSTEELEILSQLASGVPPIPPATDADAGADAGGGGGAGAGAGAHTAATSAAAAATHVIAPGSSRPLFVDAWRACHPAATGCYSVWDTRTEARARNEGCRIDYILIDAAHYDAVLGQYQAAAAAPAAASTAATTTAAVPDPSAMISMAAAAAATAPGVAALVNTPAKWSDHAALMVTLNVPLPARAAEPAAAPAAVPTFPQSGRRIVQAGSSGGGLARFFKPAASAVNISNNSVSGSHSGAVVSNSTSSGNSSSSGNKQEAVAAAASGPLARMFAATSSAATRAAPAPAPAPASAPATAPSSATVAVVNAAEPGEDGVAAVQVQAQVEAEDAGAESAAKRRRIGEP